MTELWRKPASGAGQLHRVTDSELKGCQEQESQSSPSSQDLYTLTDCSLKQEPSAEQLFLYLQIHTHHPWGVNEKRKHQRD